MHIGTGSCRQLVQKLVAILPAISSSPETSLLFGGLGIYQFQLGDPALKTRPSSILVSGIYTLKNQVSLGIVPSLFLKKESWILEGNYSYNFFPETFWGIGSNTRKQDEMQLISRQLYLEQSSLKQVIPNLFIGPQVRWADTFGIRFEDTEGETLTPPKITGADDYSTLGMGFTIRLDARDKMMYPTKNHLLNLTVMTHPSWVGTLDTYSTFLFDARKYYDLSNTGKSILAFHFLTKLSTGEIPLQDTAILGGQNILRGYYAGRLRDNHGAQVQAELRQHVRGRLGFTIFTSTGQVWPSFDNMELDRTKITAGGGFRFNLNKEDQTNIRIDYGIGRNTSGLYITIGEAF